MSPKNRFPFLSLHPGEIAACVASLLMLVVAFGYGSHAVADHSVKNGVDVRRLAERTTRAAPEAADQARECDLPAGVDYTCIFL
jgi:hypothetical protein